MSKLISRELLALYNEGQVAPIKESMVTLTNTMTQLNDIVLASQSSITTLRQAVKNLEDNALPVDTALDSMSENPVQNKAISEALSGASPQYELVTAEDVADWFQ